MNYILGSVVKLANDPAGSHIIDACWKATEDIRHYREKIAHEIAEQANEVRTDFFGKKVWKNWNMDGYVTRRFEWGREQTLEGVHFAKTPVVRKRLWGNKAETK